MLCFQTEQLQLRHALNVVKSFPDHKISDITSTQLTEKSFPFYVVTILWSGLRRFGDNSNRLKHERNKLKCNLRRSESRRLGLKDDKVANW